MASPVQVKGGKLVPSLSLSLSKWWQQWRLRRKKAHPPILPYSVNAPLTKWNSPNGAPITVGHTLVSYRRAKKKQKTSILCEVLCSIRHFAFRSIGHTFECVHVLYTYPCTKKIGLIGGYLSLVKKSYGCTVSTAQIVISSCISSKSMYLYRAILPSHPCCIAKPSKGGGGGGKSD